MAISDEFTHFNAEGRGRMVDVTHKRIRSAWRLPAAPST